MRDGSVRGEGSFPDLGDTVREAGSSPHRSKGLQKYSSSPVAVHETVGARKPRPDKARTADERVPIPSGIMRPPTEREAKKGLGHRDGAMRRIAHPRELRVYGVLRSSLPSVARAST